MPSVGSSSSNWMCGMWTIGLENPLPDRQKGICAGRNLAGGTGYHELF